jgi:vacuolar-type H+-ATPase subunit I/STV1
MTTRALGPPAARPAVSRRFRFRLRRRSRKVALTAHILSSVGWFGIAVVVAFCGIAAAVTADQTLPPALYRVMETGPWLSIPFGLIAVVTGALLGLGTAFGLIRHWWVILKLVIAIAVIVTDALLVGRIAHDAVVAGDAEAALYGSTIAHVWVLAVATVLSVFKPGGRTPWGSDRSDRAAREATPAERPEQ